MLLIPTELFPIIAFLFAVIFGRIGTIIADMFRKESVSVDISSQPTEKTDMAEANFANRG